ncbi:hypothetical protein [Actinospongicola halichondriae]|uniref:hypothetical protein n=1 Tax=Actinospongicola halichondriae TaxID=3236844 RepID=UPI003D41C931
MVALGVTAAACTSGPDTESGSTELPDEATFCDEASDAYRETLHQNETFFVGSTLERLVSVASTEADREKLVEAEAAVKRFEEVDAAPVDLNSLPAAYTDDEQESIVNALTLVSLTCKDSFPPRSDLGVDFSTPQDPAASSASTDIRTLAPMDLGVVDLGNDAFPAPYEVTYEGGVTCVLFESDPEGEPLCSSGEREEIILVSQSVDSVAILGPPTTETEIAVRESNGDEFSATMLTPHLWVVDTTEHQAPFIARIGDYQCFAIAVGLGGTEQCIERSFW